MAYTFRTLTKNSQMRCQQSTKFLLLGLLKEKSRYDCLRLSALIAHNYEKFYPQVQCDIIYTTMTMSNHINNRTLLLDDLC